jgi:transcriptional regulator GlxA family with amidase domain
MRLITRFNLQTRIHLYRRIPSRRSRSPQREASRYALELLRPSCQGIPKVVVRPEPIYLRDGSIYTSAGITAGIDLSLALVEEDHGHETALKIARFLVMFLVRPGGQAQYSHTLSHQAITSRPLRELQVWMLQHLREDLIVESLAGRIGMSARHFTRICLRDTGMNPGQFVDRMRVEAAQQIIDSSSRGLKEVADTCGFKSADAMRHTFLRVLGVTAAEYASRFKSTLARGAVS